MSKRLVSGKDVMVVIIYNSKLVELGFPSIYKVATQEVINYEDIHQ